MKWVKCLAVLTYSDNELSVGNIYEVISFNTYVITNTLDDGVIIGTVINIINDLGKNIKYHFTSVSSSPLFEDITAEIREERINTILNKQDEQ